MSQKDKVLLLSQGVVIVLASVAAVYAFQHVQTSIRIAGISAYHCASYLLAVFLCYFSVFKHNQYLALLLSLLVLVTFISILLPVRPVIQFLPAITFSLAVLIGIFSVFAVPSERGRYFVTFLIVLILPAILAESLVNWSQFFLDIVTLGEIYPFVSPLAPLFRIFREGFLLLTSDDRINPYELYTVCFAVVAGYVYLRYTTQIALTQQELIKRGASAKDIATISKGILLIAGIVASAVAATLLVTVMAPLIANVIQPLIVEIPLLVFLLGIGMGATVVTAIYVYTKTIAGPLPKIKKPSFPSIQREMPKYLGLPSYRNHLGPTIDLEQVCVDDKEAYEALRETMFLDPRMIEMSMEESAKKARSSEKEGDVVRARFWYQMVGGLAIYIGDVTKVRQYFGKCAALSPDSNYTILKIPERAVSKAQEYYRKNEFL